MTANINLGYLEYSDKSVMNTIIVIMVLFVKNL